MANLTPALLRAARALLDWSQEELAERAGVGWSTVRDFESGRRQLRRASHDAIVGALASQVVFFGENEVSPHGGPGVRLAGSDPQPATSRARVQTSRRPPASSRKRKSARTVPDDPPRDRPASTDAEMAARFARLDELSLTFKESQRRLDKIIGKSGSDDAT